MSSWIMWPGVAVGFATSCVMGLSLLRELRERRAARSVPTGQEASDGTAD